MVSFQVAGTDKPNLIGNELDGEPGDTTHSPDIFLESGYNHWKTVYDSDDSCDDDDDDLIFTANRLEFSRKQAKLVLAFAHATGGKDVPTLSALKNTWKQMLELTGNPTTRYESDTGHIFYVNEVTSALAKASN
ncbi:hypothetical protein FRC11_003422 [Ceratobasidium sp. 423]|nr:hypothetical protein FRC11_003422 [Ceratobasidium sp. 423]